MKYREIKVKTTHENADTVSLAFIECGSPGAQVSDASETLNIINGGGNWDYVDDSLRAEAGGEAVVIGGFLEDFDESILIETIKLYTGSVPEYTSSVKETEDWENSWKEDYDILDYKKFRIVPVWMDRDGLEPKVLINPGHGFGTGRHESTSMCLSLIAEADLTGKSVIDVGCGNGILGMAALKTGAVSCIFTDIDGEACDDAAEMLRLNNLSGDIVCAGIGEEEFPAKDIVLANMTGEILIRFKEDIIRLMKKGSVLIAGGIREELKEKFFIEYEELKTVSILMGGEFTAVMMEKK